MARKTERSSPVIEEELAMQIERAIAGKFDLTDAQIKVIADGIADYVDVVAEDAFDAGYNHAVDEEVDE